MATDPMHRYDFVLLFDVTNGNPNGDPDAGNAPRIDPETGHGLVSDVCIKRKIRNFISLVKTEPDGEPAPGYDIYIKERSVLNNQHARAYEALKSEGLQIDRKTGKSIPGNENMARQWMCRTFFDVRMFGAVMTFAINAGQVRGPVQITFARSLDPIFPVPQTITRMAVTTEQEAQAQAGGNRTMGRKEIIPYALYRCHGFVNPLLGAQTGLSEQDLQLLWNALAQMFELDRSAARGEMATQKLFVFEHQNALGSAPAHKLFEKIEIVRKDTSKAPRRFSDYEVKLLGGIPAGVKLHELA